MAARKIARRPDGMWIRLPLPPELVGAVERHTGAIGELVDGARELLEGGAGVAERLRELGARALEEAEALDRDVQRARRAMDGRRRRRRRSSGR